MESGKGFTMRNVIVCTFNLIHRLVRVIKSRRLRWTGHEARIGDRSAFKMLTGKPIGKIPSGRPRRKRDDNIRMDPKEICTNINTGNLVISVQDGDY